MFISLYLYMISSGFKISAARPPRMMKPLAPLGASGFAPFPGPETELPFRAVMCWPEQLQVQHGET